MKKSAQPATTQAFTEILDIRDNIVLLRGNTACLVIRVTSVNFTLLSAQEQDSKVFAYASLLNSLSFPIQILIRSKPIQITPYIASLEEGIGKTTNQLLKVYIAKYRDFITGLVKETTVLDKQFYVVIPYSSLEGGATSVISGRGNSDTLDYLFQQAQTTLQTKAESILSQLSRMSLIATILEKETLVRLFYDIYNQGESLSISQKDVENPMIHKT